MKKIIVTIALGFLVIACNFFSPYGKKVTINNTLEVYYKGDNITQNDAKKLGDFLADTWKESTNKKSLQLLKENNIYLIKMVVDTEKVKTDSSLTFSLMAIQYLLESQVFKGEKVKFVLTDNTFKDIQSFKQTPNKDTSSQH